VPTPDIARAAEARPQFNGSLRRALRGFLDLLNLIDIRTVRRLRFEMDVEAVTKDLAETTSVSVAPTSMALWLRPRDRAR